MANWTVRKKKLKKNGWKFNGYFEHEPYWKRDNDKIFRKDLIVLSDEEFNSIIKIEGGD